jgi:hypothetical protein
MTLGSFHHRYLFNLDGEEKGQVSKRRRTGTGTDVRNHS